MRRNRWLLLGLLVLTISGLAVAVIRSDRFQKWYRPPVLELPAVDQIAEMRISLRPIWSGDPIPEFVIPPEHVSSILFWLTPGKYAGDIVSQGVDRGIYEEIGEIMIRTKVGDELRLRCHDWGKNPVAFTANGSDFFLGRSENAEGWGIAGGVELHRAVRKAYDASRR